MDAIEYLEDDVPAFMQLGCLEQHEGMMLMACGIFEPEAPNAPWVVAHIARSRDGLVLRRPFVVVEQAAVTRVYDGIDDLGDR